MKKKYKLQNILKACNLKTAKDAYITITLYFLMLKKNLFFFSIEQFNFQVTFFINDTFQTFILKFSINAKASP